MSEINEREMTGIRFNGIDLAEVAPVMIEDIKVNPIGLSPVARQRIGYGQDFIRMQETNRTIVITLALQTEDKDERFQQLQDIVAWCMPYQEAVLNLPMFANKHFDVRCTGYPEPSYRQWWEARLRLVFTTYDNPYLTSDDEIRANCGQPFTIGGTAAPLMRIERTLSSAVANQTYAADGKSMVFSQIPAGNMVIDLNKQTAAVSGASIMQYFSKTGKFITPRTGNITVTGTGTVVYRERWV